jgi:hypothetical protein
LQSLTSVEDLKLRIVNNESRIDFVISDDPVILANRYATQRLGSPGFGVRSSGVIFLMPLTPQHAVICYDNLTYTAADLDNGRILIKRDPDANAINEFQFVKGAENIDFKDWQTRQHVLNEYARYKGNRREDWSEITVLVPDDNGKDGALREDGKIQNYRTGTREEGRAVGSALLKLNFIYPVPTTWFPQLKYRSKPKTFYNGTGVGHVRKEEWLRTRYEGYCRLPISGPRRLVGAAELPIHHPSGRRGDTSVGLLFRPFVKKCGSSRTSNNAELLKPHLGTCLAAWSSYGTLLCL